MADDKTYPRIHPDKYWCVELAPGKVIACDDGGAAEEAVTLVKEAMQDALEALNFYADVEDYKAPFTGAMGKLWQDCGETARAAIAKLTGA